MKKISIDVNGVHVRTRWLHILVDAKDVDGEFIKIMGKGKISPITPNWIDYYCELIVISVNYNNQ